MEKKEFYMQRCLTLALKGLGNVSSNPMVGCVIVHDNKIIGEGFHQKYGSPHAEVNAIDSVKNKSLLSKSTLYVNLEPCSHFGKTPPCCNLIIEKKIPNVVIGCLDTFSKVSGKGAQRMKDANIKVDIGCLENKCRKLNKRFFTFHEKNRPYIILKWAESKDGYIAPNNQNKPFWMTSNKSKKLVHKWRTEEDAILVGRATVEKDNPLLTSREKKGNNPIRIVIDKSLKLSQNHNIFNSESKTIIFNEILSSDKSTNNYIKINFKKIIDNILEQLYSKNIQSVIIEGGTKTLQSFIDANTWDEARIFTTKKELIQGVIAPNITGMVSEQKEIDVDFLKILYNA
ncbi:MAG: riboflavin biosynthesis protein RibD [Flavobacteriales bacterium]|nr:riboflavin biosynthesis protein RibD [Flavobacteriales bacterium]|tara:strand:+ start:32664 stop:33692 length:1029 start_codon:yes stop_codon:yes gene_type:complete